MKVDEKPLPAPATTPTKGGTKPLPEQPTPVPPAPATKPSPGAPAVPTPAPAAKPAPGAPAVPAVPAAPAPSKPAPGAAPALRPANKGGTKPLVFAPPADTAPAPVAPSVPPPAPPPLPYITGSIQHYFADPMPNSSGAGGQRQIEVTQSSIAAIGSTLPLMYGANLRQGAMIAGLVEWNGMLYLLALVAAGKLRTFGAVLLDDTVVDSTVYVESYQGTASQGFSTRLAQAYYSKGVTFADKMPGIAYRIIGIPADYGMQSFPRVTIEVLDATEVLDVRTGAASSSINPVNALADLITSTVYGAGRTYDVASFKSAADFCDELIGTAPQIPRKRLSLSITKAMKVDDAITNLASYTGCFIWNTGGKYYLNPLRRSSSVAFFSDANILASSFKLNRNAMRDMPTSATVNYTDISVTPFHTAPARVEMPEVTAGTYPDRNMASSMPGVTSYSQALHDATEYLNRAIVARLAASWGAFDDAVTLIPGNVVTLSKPKYGLNSQLMLVTDVIDSGFGRYSVSAESYADAEFSDTVLAGPPAIDTGAMVPGVVVDFVGPVTGTEVLQLLQDGTWVDYIRYIWPIPSNVAALAYYAAVLYDVTNTAAVVQMAARNTPTNEFVTDALVQGHVYRLGVATVSYVGAASDVVWSADLTLQGKLLPPGNVLSFQATVQDQSVFFTWSLVTDIDLDGYEIRRGTVGQAWATMTFLDHLYSVTDYLAGQPPGTWDYAIKAHDSSGNYSLTEKRTTATIQAPDFGVLAQHTWLAAEANLVSNFSKYAVPDGTNRFVNIDSNGHWGDGADNPNDAVGTFDDSLKNVIIAVPTPTGTSQMIWTTFDFGAAYTGTWQFTGTLETLYGAGAVDVGCYLGSIPNPNISLLTHVSAKSTNTTSVSTAAIDTTGADLLIAHVGSYGTPVLVSDSKGNVWIPLTAHQAAGGRQASQFVYAKNPIVGAGHTFSTAVTTGSYPAIAVAAFKGSDLAAPFDVQNGGNALSVGLSVQVGSITPSANSALIVAGLSEYQNFGSPMAIDSGMTIIESQLFSSGNSFGTTFAYKVQGAKAAINPTWSWPTNGDYSAFSDAAFKFAGMVLARFSNNTVTLAQAAEVIITVPAGTTARVYDDWRVTCTANVRQESGTLTVPASGVATVTLKGKYAQRLSLIAAAGAKTVPPGTAYATWSNVVLSASASNTFQINVIDVASGTACGAPVDWYFKGI